MGKITLVTGGVRSGKSAFAEALLLSFQSVGYIATGVVNQPDEEFKERIKLHQQRRPKTWETYEGFSNLAEYVSNSSCQYYLLDCITMLVTNLLFNIVEKKYPTKLAMNDQVFLNKQEQIEIMGDIQKEIVNLLEMIKNSNKEIVIVTNEIGLGVVPPTKLGRYFRDLIGKMNQFLAKEAQEVYFVISGLPQKIK